MQKYTLLLISLAFLLVFIPQLENSKFGSVIMLAGFSVVYVAALLANRHRRVLFRIGIGVGILTLIMSWSDLAVHSLPLLIISQFMAVVFLVMIIVMIVTAIFKHYSITVQTVLAAICIYLLIGLTWAMLYRTAELVETNPFKFAYPENRKPIPKFDGVEMTPFSQMVYFSFVTMSTLGYGDITPSTSLSQTLAWTQAIVGQLYIAILVAWLVSALPKGRKQME